MKDSSKQIKDASNQQLIKFSEFNATKLYSQVRKLIKKNNLRIAELIQASSAKDFKLNWGNSASLLDDWDEELFERTFNVAGHIKSVCDNPKLRNAYNKCLPDLSAYITALKQDEKLYALLKRLRGVRGLDKEQQQTLDNHLRDCRLAGIELPKAQKKKFAELAAESSRLAAKFNENLLDSTDKWQEQVTDKKTLSGLPKPVVDAFKQNAKQANKDGWLLRLDIPSYLAIITYADNESLRQRVYIAYTTRASTENPLFASYDNTPIIHKIMLTRSKMAKILGYKNPAEMLMATNMVRKSPKVVKFLKDLLAKVLPAAEKEAAELREYVLKHQDTFNPWDIAYYSEKLKQEMFQVDKEKLREYFPLPRVLQGMFSLADKLFGVTLVEVQGADTWHKDVRLFKLVRKSGRTRKSALVKGGAIEPDVLGYLYCDLYARRHKNGGAWMNESIIRRRLGTGDLQLPVAYLVCNFRKPSAGDTLLLHDDVLVLFHELGHCLHHLLTKIEQPGIAGINGVPHDMIELPSQLLENWCWDKKFIKLISEHYKTGKQLPSNQLDKILAARNFQSGLTMLRQLEFSLFDIMLHSQYDQYEKRDKYRVAKSGKGNMAAQNLHNELRYKYNPLPQLKKAKFPNSFAHIFAGGYAAGYYAYKWAEVMSADVYSMFEEQGIYHKPTADLLRTHIFERGGLGDALENFIAVRGRAPDNAAFLRYNGIVA